MFGERDVFGRGAEGAAIALAVEQPDPLADLQPCNTVADLIDNPGAVAVRNHARIFYSAIAAAAAADIGGGCARRHPAGAQPPPRARTRLLSSRARFLEGAREGAAVEQDVLAGDEAGLGAAQERAGIAEFLRIAETSSRIELGAFGQYLLYGKTALVRFALCRAAQTVGVEGAGQQA